MGLTDAALNGAAEGVTGLITHASIHTAEPDGAGSAESTAARQPITFTGAVATVDSADATLAFTGGAASGPATHIGFWTALSGGTFRGWAVLTGDQTFNAAGEYNVTSLDFDASDG